MTSQPDSYPEELEALLSSLSAPEDGSTPLSELNMLEIADAHFNQYGDERLYMAMVLNADKLDKVAPVDTEKGCLMRLDLIREIGIAALIVSPLLGWGRDLESDFNDGDRLAWLIHDLEVGVYESIQRNGFDIPMQTPLNPADVGVPEPPQ